MLCIYLYMQKLSWNGFLLIHQVGSSGDIYQAPTLRKQVRPRVLWVKRVGQEVCQPLDRRDVLVCHTAARDESAVIGGCSFEFSRTIGNSGQIYVVANVSANGWNKSVKICEDIRLFSSCSPLFNVLQVMFSGENLVQPLCFAETWSFSQGVHGVAFQVVCKWILHQVS